MTDLYTTDEMLDYAVDMEQDGLSTGAAMLRQAATDATRIATLEAEVECRKGAYDGLANANAKIDATDRHMAVLRQYLSHLRSKNPTQSTRPRISDLRAALEAVLSSRHVEAALGGVSDTARLNYLAMNPRGAEIVVEGVRKPCVFWGVSSAPENTLREAIDAAMLAAAARHPDSGEVQS